MFRRQKSEDSSEAPSSSVAPASGKGRPTPTRKEAEAARKARRKPTKNKREARKQQRKVARAERDASYRAMQSGDESHFPARDQGPVRRYVRDMVDGRRLFTEFFLPVMIVILLMSLLPIPMLVQWMTVLWLVIILLVFFELLWLGLMLRKNIARTFPGDTSKGNLTYGIIRATQLRRLRLPKPAVKPGQPPRPRVRL
jgi:hypothetical protein